MSEVAIFSFGSVMFIATAWATIAFGFRRISELQAADLREAGKVAEARDDGLTELHVSLPDDAASSTETSPES
jgi:hypothetical protein